MKTPLLLLITLFPALCIGSPPAPEFGHRLGKRSLVGLQAPTIGNTLETRARHFLTSRDDLALDTNTLVLKRTTHFGKERVLHFEQTVLGLPVEHRMVAVQLDGQGRVRSVHSDYMPVSIDAVRPDIGEAAARVAAAAHLDEAPTLQVKKVVLAMGPTLSAVAYRVTVARVPMVQH
ncbi:MAG: Zn-dependent metalloprotease, partial [Myxococcota bacterium]